MGTILRSRRAILAVLLLVGIAYLLFDIFLNNAVAVVSVEGYIDSDYAQKIVETFDSLEKNFLVRAVVLRMNSPGGEAGAVEEIYFKLLRLKNAKPVVAYMDQLGASGAYYLASQADYILARQSSEVGGVGVIIELPGEVQATNLITSGPYKVEADMEGTYRILELLKQEFVQVVQTGRGSKLKITPVELSSAKLYIGYDALELGMIDEIGGLEDAVFRAKELAGPGNYNVIEVLPGEKVRFPLYVGAEDVSSNTTSSPTFYYLYLKLREEGGER